jgi:type IV pilus assembly protein PilB
MTDSANESDLQQSKAVRLVAAIPRGHFAENGRVSASPSRPSSGAATALLTAVEPRPGERILQIGLGSGYLTAALARGVGHVYVVERMEGLIAPVRARLHALDIQNVSFRAADGRHGWREQGPFDAILVAAARVPVTPALMDQLSEGGRLVVTEGAARTQRAIVRHRPGLEPQRVGRIALSRDVGDVLIELGLAHAAEIDRARAIALQGHRTLEEVLTEDGLLDARDVCQALAKHHGLLATPVRALLQALDPSLSEGVPRAYLEHHRLIPVSVVGGELLIATDDPHARVDELGAAYPGRGLRLTLLSPTDYRRLWSALDLRLTSEGPLEEAAAPVADDILVSDSSNLETRAVGIFESLLLDAISEQASDIHIERYGNRTRIRLRIDGELFDQSAYRLTAEETGALVNVIKVRGDLDISEKRRPQGGRMRVRAGGTPYDLRIQVQPSLHGENVVIRLLPQDAQLLTIDDLGFPPSLAKSYRRLLRSPSGLILVVGPTGSGKSTTLYGGLQLLASDARRKVITVEDPIEYSIELIQQTQVKPAIGFSFADAMRSFVRQDPDVILVGEIRDGETALEAIRASQTGHLVLSTLHSNDAVDAVQRLFDLGMHPNSIAAELRGVIAQRLAKRVCTGCRRQAEPDPEILAELYPKGAPADFTCFEGAGCSRCGGRGTRGRVASVEFVAVNAEIRKAISRQPPLDELRDLAVEAGLHSLRRSVVDQILAGLIPITEARRLLQVEAMARD